MRTRVQTRLGTSFWWLRGTRGGGWAVADLVVHLKMTKRIEESYWERTSCWIWDEELVAKSFVFPAEYESVEIPIVLGVIYLMKHCRFGRII